VKHNCKFKDPDDGTIYKPFLQAVLDGYIEYEDLLDAYTISMKSIRKIKTRQICGLWLPDKYRHTIERLEYCPFCGDRIFDNEDGFFHPKNRIKEP